MALPMDWEKVNQYCIEQGKNRVTKLMLPDGSFEYRAWNGKDTFCKSYKTAQEAIDALEKPTFKDLFCPLIDNPSKRRSKR